MSFLIFKRISSSFFSLVGVRLVNIAFPLILMPYIIDSIGIDEYGRIEFYLSIGALLIIAGDFGFELTATKDVATCSTRVERSQIFANVFFAKFLITSFFCFLASFLIIILNVADFIYFFVLMFFVFGRVFFPLWFFLGLENLKGVFFAVLSEKAIILLFALFFVSSPNDSFYFFLCICLLPFFVSLIFNVFLFYILDVRVSNFSLKNFFLQLSLGKDIFFSKVAVSSYTSLNIVLLGALSDTTAVGLFSVANKVVSAFGFLGGIFNQVLYPYMSRAKVDGIAKFDYFYYRVTIAFSLGLFFYCIASWVFMKIILPVFFLDYLTILNVCFLMIPLIFLVPLGGWFTQYFVVLDKGVIVRRVTFYTAIFNFIFVAPFVIFNGVYGLAFFVCFVQIFHIFLYLREYVFLKKRGNEWKRLR